MESDSKNDERSRLHPAFLELLERIHSFAQPPNAPDHKLFSETCIDYLNTNTLSPIVKKEMAPLLSKLFKITFKNDHFILGRNIPPEEFMEAISSLQSYKMFEINIYKMEKEDIFSDSFTRQGSKLINANNDAIYWVSFVGTAIIDNFQKEQLVGLLSNILPDLMRNMGNTQETLLEKLIFRARADENLQNLLIKCIKDQKIDIDIQSSKGNTFRELFKQHLNVDYMKKKDRVAKCLFEYYAPPFFKLTPLNLSKANRDRLEKLVTDDDEFEQDFTGIGEEGLTVHVCCKKNRIHCTFNNDNQEYQVACSFMPPSNSKVHWKILKIKDNVEIYLIDDDSDKISNNNEGTTTININESGGELLKLQVYDQLSVRNLESNPKEEFGRLIWLPMYKAEKNIRKNIIINDSENSEDEDPIPPKIIANPDQKIFAGLALFQDLMTIPTQNYSINGKDIVCQNPRAAEMVDNFERVDLPGLVKTWFKGSLQHVAQFNQISNLMKALKRYGKENQITFKVDPNENGVLFGQVTEGYQENIDKLCNYLLLNPHEEEEIDNFPANPEEQETLRNLSSSFPDIKQSKISDTKINLVGKPRKIKLLQEIIIYDTIRQTRDDLDAVEELTKEDVHFMEDLKRRGLVIEALDNHTYNVEGKAKEYSELISRLQKIKSQHQKRVGEELMCLISERQYRRYLRKYDTELSKFPNTSAKILKSEMDADPCNFTISFPKKVESDVKVCLSNLRQEILIENIAVINTSSESFVVKNISLELVTQIKETLQESQKQFRNEPSFTIENSVEMKCFSSVSFKKVASNDNEYMMELLHGNKSEINKFIEDQAAVERFIKSYIHLKKEFSNEKIQGLIKKVLSTFKTTDQKTTSHKRVFHSIRIIYFELLTEIIEPLRKKYSDNFEKKALGHVATRLAAPFDPNSISNFLEQWKVSCNVKIIRRYSEKMIEEYLQTSKLSKDKGKSYTKVVNENIKDQVDRVQHMIDQSQTIDIDQITMLKRCIEINCKTYFTIDLPIVDHLQDFREKFLKTRLMVVKTGTGSGKSTVLPPFILGLGYRHIMVTQPRRLPCQRIFQRISDTYGNGIVGYRIAGESRNESNDLIYITDGLLKENMYRNEDFLKDVDVVMLDEVHEETKNIDLILLHLSKVMNTYPKLKVILCSATINDALVSLFDIPHKTFEVNIAGFPVQEHEIKDVSILQKVHELSGSLKKDEQILVFFPSVGEVMEYQRYFEEEYKRKSYVLYGNQRTQLQEEAMNEGQIIFSTSVSETSLTFPKLKYVVDSRKSRVQLYDINQRIMMSKELMASKSSIMQRKGRLGRNQPGDYYYYVYNQHVSQSTNYDLSELDRVDLLPVCFELLMVFKDWKLVEAELSRLKFQDQNSFKAKMRQAEAILRGLGDLVFSGSSSKISNTCTNEIIKFGNLSNVYYNLVLYRSIVDNCYDNMVAVVSFAMMGLPIISTVLKHINADKTKCSGDIQAVGQFLLALRGKINLDNIDPKEVSKALRALPGLSILQHSYSILVRVLVQMKKLFAIHRRNRKSSQWDKVNQILATTFTNNIYFNRCMIGGNKLYFEKILPNRSFNLNNVIGQVSNVQFQLTWDSVVYDRNNPEQNPYILALGNTINPFDSCTLSFCCKINPSNIKTEIVLQIEEFLDNIGNFTKVDESSVYNSAVGTNNNATVGKVGSMVRINGPFYSVLKRYKDIDGSLCKVWTVDLKDELLLAINDRKQMGRKRPIDQEDIESNFNKLQFFSLFKSLHDEFKYIYNVEVKWKNNGKADVLGASNFVFSIFYKKIQGFFSWFVDAQIVIANDMKQPPLHPSEKALIKMGMTGVQYKQMMERINEIVDPNISLSIVKSWVNGEFSTRSPRTYRMVAVAWILTNKYDCSVKGGFVRDWVVNGKEKLPKPPLNHIIQPDPYTKFYKLADDTILPNDIDADMSPDKTFIFEKFKGDMNKLGITVEMLDDKWRYLIVFDREAPSGGFTMDLIQPFCYISHDRCDFDVNLMYLKSGHYNQIGLKIPLKLRRMATKANNEIEVKLEQLIMDCRASRMRNITTNLDSNRIKKFQKRGWIIDPSLFEPVMHQTLRSTFSTISESELDKIDPKFLQSMKVKYKMKQIQQIRNYCFEIAYDSAKCWVAAETKGDLNERFLYHGTSQQGAKNISKFGFDSRYYGSVAGQWYGTGAYFADDPMYADRYTKANPNGEKYMLICIGVLGKQEELTVVQQDKKGPAKGYHSVYGNAPNKQQHIVNRWGQVRPLVYVTYQ